MGWAESSRWRSQPKAGGSSSTRARSADLQAVAAELRVAGAAGVTALAGNVAEPEHRMLIAEAVDSLGGLDLLVNNASLLGPSPQPLLADYPLDIGGGRSTRSMSSPRSLSRSPCSRHFASGAGHHRQRQLGCGRRAVRRVGRLRLVEGRPGPALGDPGGRGAGLGRSMPSIPVTCGPACIRRPSPRGHLRPPRARDSGSRSCCGCSTSRRRAAAIARGPSRTARRMSIKSDPAAGDPGRAPRWQ